MNQETDHPQTMPEVKVLDQLNEAFYQVYIFRAALEMEVFAKVATGEDTSEQMAAKEGWDPVGTRMLLDDLCCLKLLERDGPRYRLVPESECYLLPEKPAYWGRLLLSEFNWEGNGGLAEAIRTGRRPIGYSATTPEVVDTWIACYARRWSAPDAYQEQSDELWRTLGIQARDGLRVLDVACGPAPRSLALARCHPGVGVTLLDWEPILQRARRVAGTLGVEKQVKTIAGDLWSVDYGLDQFDAIYLGNITHFFGPEENARLFRKAHDALVRGGVLVISAARRDDPSLGVTLLWLYAVSASGAAYDFGEYKSMLERAGFSHVEDINHQQIKAVRA